MKTPKEYVESVQKLKPTAYIFGEKVENIADHPMIKPMINAVALTYGLSADPEYENLFTATSHLTGKKINRFVHIHQSAEDLVKRVQMMRVLTPKHGMCVGSRCVGFDALNAVYSATYDMDHKLGTDYHKRLVEFLKYVQENDLAVAGSMTDVKGDRSLKPSKQANPDAYVRVVEKREDGIVVRGAKAHQSQAMIAHEMLVMPTEAMGLEDATYAVSFAIPSDAKGIIHIFEAPIPNLARLVADDMDLGNARFGVHGATLVIFDDVFVPNERVFMCKEYEFSGALVERFARLHRLGFVGCKPGHVDLLTGASALMAEYIGVEKVSHIRDKLTDMAYMNELAYGCGIGAAHLGYATPSGAYLPNMMLTNAAKLQAVEAVYQASKSATDITGGLICTVPTEKDFRNPDIGKHVEKYLKAKPDIPTEDRIRLVRLIEFLVGQGSFIPAESMHGGGPPATQKIMIRFAADFERFKKFAKAIARIKE